MTVLRHSGLLRKLIWRAGRWLYMHARGDSKNDPRVNGEYWLLKSLIRQRIGPLVLFDIGANKGNWTAKALESSESRELSIRAFEPSTETRKLLTARFANCNGVAVHGHALSATTGRAKFFGGSGGGGTNSLSVVSGQRFEMVEQTTLDDFCRAAGVQHILMAKIDTEGYDLLVLRGAEALLQEGRIEVVQFEYNWRWLLNHASLRDVFQLIEGKPYRLGKLVGHSIEIYDAWHFELDRFFENNYVLLRRDTSLARSGIVMTFGEENAVERA